MTWLAVAIGVLIAATLLVANSIYHTAHRLDRLHVRYDLSWQALDGALARRAVVARAVAADAYRGRPEGNRLAALAYRLLGSAADAEDAVQDAFLHWQAADRQRIRVPEAWLTKVVTHLCLDRLRSARARRASRGRRRAPRRGRRRSRRSGSARRRRRRAGGASGPRRRRGSRRR